MTLEQYLNDEGYEKIYSDAVGEVTIIYNADEGQVLIQTCDTETGETTVGGLIADDTDLFAGNEAAEAAAALAAVAGVVELTSTVGSGTITGDRIPASEDVNETLLAVAAEHGLTAEFRYAKGDGSIIETRNVAVENVDDGLLVGFDNDRQDVRAFRLDRIKGQVSL